MQKSQIQALLSREDLILRSKQATSGSEVSGRYKVQVVDVKSGKVVEDRPWAKNLILDWGLDQWFTSVYANALTTHCAAGIGTDPFVRDSVAVTASATGGDITASSAFFEASDVGRTLKFDSGEFGRITAFTSSTEVTWDGPAAVSTDQFAIHYTNRTALATETERTSTYLTGAGNTERIIGSLVSERHVIYKRTYDFPIPSVTRNYTELGWAPASTGNLFSGTLISGGAITVNTSQRLRVVYELKFVVGPWPALDQTPTITGWPVSPSDTTAGKAAAFRISANTGWSSMESNGNPSPIPGGLSVSFEPRSQGNNSTARLYTNPFSISWGVTPSLGTTSSAINSSALGYTNGSFTRVKRYTFGTGDGNGSNWRGVIFQSDNYTFQFDQNQTKVDTHVLVLDFRYTATRELNNP